ncbi:LacI family DNA-binding transcriptional regulator [Microbacterium sp. LMI1-1-1.1]|uniref:LacI family DNA-binding transcriptional regulator n=1 Tax=unclassified Microbacterium TaxID=2609290 RepID=UPI001F852018|nr:LacI family transcriptional regulator [Actinomycetota bacterium]
MSGIADVARLAGVSKSTASRALTGGGYVSDGTRRRVTDAAASLGYVPTTSAVSLATGRTRTIALIVPKVNRWYFGAIVEGVERSLIPHGYDLTLYVAEPGSRDRESLYSTYLARKRFDGIIAVALEPDDSDLERLVAIDKPTVSIGNALGDIATLGLDNVAITRIITEHLITLGHTDIAFVGSTPPTDAPARDVDERSIGYRNAMNDNGLAVRIRAVPSTLTITDAYAAAASFLADAANRPTGIVAACDEVAIGVIIAARRLGISVPTQLSVVGIDGHDYAEMFALTTIEQYPRDQGTAAAGLLISMIEGVAAPLRTPAATRLVVRASTAPPRSV